MFSVFFLKAVQAILDVQEAILILIVIGTVVWSLRRWIRSYVSPYIWIASEAAVKESWVSVDRKGWSAWFSRVPYMVSWSGEYNANGTRYPIHAAIMYSKLSPGMSVPIVYLQGCPSVWRYRSAQEPGVERHVEAKALVLWLVILLGFVYASLVIGLHDAGYSWPQSLLFWR